MVVGSAMQSACCYIARALHERQTPTLHVACMHAPRSSPLPSVRSCTSAQKVRSNSSNSSTWACLSRRRCLIIDGDVMVVRLARQGG